MDGIVGAQQLQHEHQRQQHQHQHQQQQQQQQHQQQQQQQLRGKKWRAVSASSTEATAERLFQSNSGSSMSLIARPRDSTPRNGVYHEADASQSAKDGDRVDEAQLMRQASDPSADVCIDDPDEALQHRISDVARQREHLQQLELELRVRFFARSEILRLQTSFEEQAKQHNEIVTSLQEKLQEREGQMQQLRQHLQDREQQLQMEANEAMKQVWAKDALLREQTTEVANLRRERESAIAEHKAETSQLDAERAGLLAQVDGLKEQVHEKERRLQEIEEQDIFFSNDKQLRDAQMWMARAQEMEVYHMNEHRERSEQMQVMWLSYQRQLAEMERYYNQIIQKLQQDMAESSHYARNKELDEAMRVPTDSGMHHQLKPAMVALNDPLGLMVAPDGLPKIEHATGLPVLPTPMLGMAPIVPSANNMHQYGAVHQQAVGSSLPQFSPPGPGQVQLLPSVVVAPQKQQGPPYHAVQVVQRPQRQQQVVVEQHQPAVNAHAQDRCFKPEAVPQAVEPVFLSSQFLDQTHQQAEKQSEILHKPANRAVFNSVIERAKPQTEQEKTGPADANGRQQKHELKTPTSTQNENSSTENGGLHKEPSGNAKPEDTSQACEVSSNGKAVDPQLLDRDSLLACLIRVIPAEPSAKIRISSTLPNRLGKMLAPLHWHDYRKHYGRLDEFVDAHPLLFVVEGDFIHLREGAHAIVSTSTAVAKATAAALMPSGGLQASKVALTPVAQPQVQRSRIKPSEQQDKKRSTAPSDAAQGAENPAAVKNSAVQYKAQIKRSPGLKENGLTSAEVANGFTNGVIDGYINFDRPGSYFKNRSQDLGARPQTQEGRILEAA